VANGSREEVQLTKSGDYTHHSLKPCYEGIKGSGQGEEQEGG